jgi:hypothetical protein
MVLAGRRGRRSVAESEASKRESRLGSGGKSSIERFEGGVWYRKLCKTTRGEGSVFIFLGFEPRYAGVGARATKLVQPTMHGALLPHRQGCAMFIRCFFQ